MRTKIDMRFPNAEIYKALRKRPIVAKWKVANYMGITENELNGYVYNWELDEETKANVIDAINDVRKMVESGEKIKRPKTKKDRMRETLFHVDLAVGDAQVELEDMEHMEAVKECLGLARAYIKELERIIQ